MKERSALAGSLIAGLLASICCIGPLVLGAVGLGSLGFAAALAPLRPWFLGITGVLIAVGFFLAYRPQSVEACAPGEVCTKPGSRRNQRVALWLVTVLAVALATYPSWGARSSPRRAPVTATSAAGSVVVLEVDGMTCSACEGEIAHELEREPGVRQAQVSFEARRATVMLEKHVPVDELTAAVIRAGYRARVVAQ